MNLGEIPEAGPAENARLFATTHWSIVQRARENSSAALNHLFTQYRQPMIVYLCGRGTPKDRAEDLVQSFCAHLLRRDFLANVARQKGKFRTFLLTSLKNFIADQYARDSAQKRGGGAVPSSLDEANEDGEALLSPKSNARSADLEFDKAWAQAILNNAIARLRSECAASGHGKLCEWLEPVFFEDETSASYREIGLQLGMSEGNVKVTAHRIRQRLRGLLREEIMQTVGDQADFGEELAYLISLFGR